MARPFPLGRPRSRSYALRAGALWVLALWADAQRVVSPRGRGVGPSSEVLPIVGFARPGVGGSGGCALRSVSVSSPYGLEAG